MTLPTTTSLGPAIRWEARGAERRLGLPLLTVLLLALTALRVGALFLSPSELGFDEAQYWAWSRHLAFGYFTKPPLTAWVIAAETAVCGDGAACVRAASPIVHMASALLLYGLGTRLYDRTTGFWSALFYALMPGVAVSSVLMTTDVFLLFFWSAALLVLAADLRAPRAATALGFGLLVGIGLYAKYAMIYLPVLAMLYGLATPGARRVVFRPAFLGGLLVAVAIAVPNLWWNATHHFATFEHTGDNIGWSLSRLNWRKGFEFLGSQFGVAGPIVFGAMVNAFLFRARTEATGADRLLLWFSVPIVLAITIQGFLSQANANWAATAYPAGVVLATALMLRSPTRFFAVANLAIGLLVAAILVVGTAVYDPAGASGPLVQLRQLSGWKTTAANLERVARQVGARRLVLQGRALTAGLLHPLRRSHLDIRAYLAPGDQPTDQFQLDRPWRDGDSSQDTLIFGIGRDTAERLNAVPIATIDAPIYSARDGRMTVYRLSEDASAPAAPGG